MAKAPQTSRGNDRHGRHCHGENRNNQTKTKKPARRIPRTGDTSGLSDQRSQTRHNKKANDDNDDNDVREPERQRQCIDNHDDPKCCECTRYSTCTLLVGRKGGKACASCLIAKRKCRNCRCLNTSCRNQRDDLSATCTTEVTMKKLFPTANGCGESLIPTPPAAAARPWLTVKIRVKTDGVRKGGAGGIVVTRLCQCIVSHFCTAPLLCAARPVVRSQRVVHRVVPDFLVMIAHWFPICLLPP